MLEILLDVLRVIYGVGVQVVQTIIMLVRAEAIHAFLSTYVVNSQQTIQNVIELGSLILVLGVLNSLFRKKKDPKLAIRRAFEDE